MMQDIKPIQTYYNGYHFRSRLEARWQVFFDAMGVHAIYEHEGYERHFGDGEILRYLPDFYFPKYDLWGEVKGVDSLDKIPKDDAERISWFIDFNGVCKNGIILLGNIPEPNEYLDYAIWRWTGKGLEFGYTDDLSSHRLEVVQGVDSAPCHFETDWRPTCSWGNKQKRTKVWTALEKARAARFEYGETPNSPTRSHSITAKSIHPQKQVKTLHSNKKFQKKSKYDININGLVELMNDKEMLNFLDEVATRLNAIREMKGDRNYGITNL